MKTLTELYNEHNSISMAEVKKRRVIKILEMLEHHALRKGMHSTKYCVPLHDPFLDKLQKNYPDLEEMAKNIIEVIIGDLFKESTND